MLRSIVVPLDGSRFAERALPIASRIAKVSVAMTTHGYSGFKRLLLGSVTNEARLASGPEAGQVGRGEKMILSA